MAGIPDNIKKNIVALAKGENLESQKLLNEYIDIYKKDETCKSMPDENDDQKMFKLNFAWAILVGKYKRVGANFQLHIMPLAKPNPSPTKAGKNRGLLSALVRKVETDGDGNETKSEIMLGAGTLWEKAADSMKKTSREKAYKVSLGTTNVESKINDTIIKGFELKSNDATFEECETEFPSILEFYKEYFEPKEKKILIALDELDIHKGANVMDVRIIKGQIMDVRSGQSADGREWGMYVIFDDTILATKSGKDNIGSVAFYVHPDDLIYEKGSFIKSVGRAKTNFKDENKTDWESYLVVPAGVYANRKITSKPVEKKEENVDIDDLDKELDDEHKKAEKDAIDDLGDLAV